MLDVERLTVDYRHGRTWRRIVDGVSFRIAAGEAFGLVGESGSGKSSVAMAVLRSLPQAARMAATRLDFDGRDLAALSRRELRALRGERIAAVVQHPGSALNPSLTVGRQIAESFELRRGVGPIEARRRALALLERVRVRRAAAVLDLYPHELSGGMQQRVTIAMALALEPALLVLDEPTTALDASVRAEIVAILDELRRERAAGLLLISHDIGLIRRATDRVGVMQAGTIVEQGDTAAVFDRPTDAHTRLLVESLPGAIERARPVRPSQGGPPVLRCRGIGRRYGTARILEGIDLTIAPGETFGLVGESGSGKSTLGRLVTGLQQPSNGTVEIDGMAVPGPLARRGAATRRAVAMVFQSPDATLNPRHRLGRMLALPLRRLAGLRGAAVPQQATALIEAMRLPPEFLQRRPRALSGGQRQRAAIARAFAGAPRLVVLDEPTSALDASVQAAILALIDDLQRRAGTAYLFISHDLAVIRAMADQVGVLYRGRLVETGPAARVFHGPNHPYTRVLLDGMAVAPSTEVEGALDEADAGCVFAGACGLADPRCRREEPPVRDDGAGHLIRCWRDLDDLVRRAAPTA